MAKIDRDPSGKIKVSLENGPEVFTADDPLKATEEVAKALDEGKKWGKEGWEKARQYEAEIQQLKSQQPSTPPATTTEPPTQDQQLQKYLVEQWAQGLGYKNAEEAKSVLGKVVSATEEMTNQQVAANFLNACPDFPNTPESIESLSGTIEKLGWDFSPQSMIAAHALLVRENAQDGTKGYKPLTIEEQNAQWANNMAAASRQSPPPMVRSTAPDNRGQENDPWKVPLNDLRSLAIRAELEGRK